MGEPVQQSCRQGSIAKDPGPFGKGQVGGDQQRSLLVTIGKDLIQQLCSCFREWDVAEFIEDDQVKSD